MCLGPTVVPVLLTSRRRIRALSWSLSWLIPLVTSFLLALLSTVIEHTDVKPVLEGPSEETANPASPSFLRVRFNCLEISSSLEGSDAELDYEAHRFREGALGFGRRSWWLGFLRACCYGSRRNRLPHWVFLAAVLDLDRSFGTSGQLVGSSLGLTGFGLRLALCSYSGAWLED